MYLYLSGAEIQGAPPLDRQREIHKQVRIRKITGSERSKRHRCVHGPPGLPKRLNGPLDVPRRGPRRLQCGIALGIRDVFVSRAPPGADESNQAINARGNDEHGHAPSENVNANHAIRKRQATIEDSVCVHAYQPSWRD